MYGGLILIPIAHGISHSPRCFLFHFGRIFIDIQSDDCLSEEPFLAVGIYINWKWPGPLLNFIVLNIIVKRDSSMGYP